HQIPPIANERLRLHRTRLSPKRPRPITSAPTTARGNAASGHSVGTFSAPERFLLYMSRASLNAPHFHRDNRREAVGLIERDSAMGRVSQPSRTSATLIATATLAAMTAYNVYRARKVEREHP